MVCGIGILYKGLPENEVFLHILLILTVIGTNGVPEAIVAAVLTAAVCKALFRVQKRGAAA